MQVTPQRNGSPIVEPAQAYIKDSPFRDFEPHRSDSGIEGFTNKALKPDTSSARLHETQPGESNNAHPTRDHTVSLVYSTPPRSIRSGTPPPRRRSNGVRQQSSPLPQRSLTDQPIQSIFPTYDHNLPLSQQQYYPQIDSYTPSAKQLPRRSLSAGRPSLRLTTTANTVYAEPQIATYTELQALWSAASGNAQNSRVDKVKLAMHRETSSSGSEASLEIGFSNFYTFIRTSVAPAKPSDTSAEMLVRRRHHLNDMVVPVAQVDLARPQVDETSHKPMTTTIFPQTAALAALESASTSPRALSIANFDPNASSPQAAQLAFDAVADAKRREQCHVFCTSEKNQFGMLVNRYSLQHPRVGRFDITVKGQINLISKAKPQSRIGRVSSYEKVTLHHPHSSGLSGSMPEVASLDITAGVLEIDLAALRKLDSIYIIDIAVCALMAVALMESESSEYEARVEPESFRAPPIAMLKDGKRRGTAFSLRSSRVVQWTNSYKVGKQPTEKPLPELPAPPPAATLEPKLPVVLRGVLKLLGFSFQALIWLLGLGVKVLTKLLAKIGVKE